MHLARLWVEIKKISNTMKKKKGCLQVRQVSGRFPRLDLCPSWESIILKLQKWGENGEKNTIKTKGLPGGSLKTLDTTGANERSRTADLLITNQLLYQLSYVGDLFKFKYLNKLQRKY